MTKFFSPSNNGFYDESIHGSRTIPVYGEDGNQSGSVPNPSTKIPQDAVEITNEHYQALLSAQSSGMVIEPDEDGNPVAVPLPAPTTEQLAEMARARRDFLLEETDWIVIRAAELGQPVPQDWLGYRAALRNVPEQAEFPTDITWPVKPSA